MTNEQLEYASVIVAGLPGATVRTTNSGVCVWADITFNGQVFVMQITPDDGVGLSKQDLSGETDLSGHEREFSNLAEAINYIKNLFA